MFRRYLFLSTGLLGLIGMFAIPGQVQAQRGRGGPRPGFHSSFPRGFNPAFQRGFTPGFGFNRNFAFTPGFGFTPNLGFTPSFGFTPTIPVTPNFNRSFFDPRMNRRFDRSEDRFENRFGNRFGFQSPFGFPTGFQGGFVPGFSFVPGTGALPLLSTPGFPIGVSPSLFGLMFP
jgi:hypothetical protein